MPSYSPVFSAQFIVRWGADPIPAYIVEDGFTAVIRDFSMYSGAAGDICELRIQNSASAPQVCVALVSAIGSPAYGQWKGRVVVPSGGIMNLTETVVGDEADIYVGGYLLRNTVS